MSGRSPRPFPRRWMRSVVVLGTDDRPTKHWRAAVTGSMAAPIRQSLRGVGVLTGAARAIRDPRIAGMLGAGPRVMDFLVRSHRRTPGSTAMTASSRCDRPGAGGPGIRRRGADRRPPASGPLPREEDYVPAAADLQAAQEIFEVRGWLEQRAAYHRDPRLPTTSGRPRERPRAGLRTHDVLERVGALSPRSPVGPVAGARWPSHRTRLGVPGPGPGPQVLGRVRPRVRDGAEGVIDLRAFRATELHRMGINVAVVVLPLHGPRASGRVRGEDLMTIDMVDSMHGMAQATSDTRRSSPGAGIRRCRAGRGHGPVARRPRRLSRRLPRPPSSAASSPGCRWSTCPTCSVGTARLPSPSGRGIRGAGVATRCTTSSRRWPWAARWPRSRYIYAGLGDRMSTFGQARRLWLHWERPGARHVPGGHMGFFWSNSVKELVAEAMTSSYPEGLQPAARGARGGFDR